MALENQEKAAELAKHVTSAVSLGCHEAAIGKAKMPEGYALMVDPDDAYCFWLNWQGKESAIHWDKWAVFRGAKEHANPAAVDVAKESH